VLCRSRNPAFSRNASFLTTLLDVQEGAGAAGLAALLSGQLPELKGKKVVIPLCGGNIDTTVLGRVIERGLAADGRLVRFSVIVSDRPGGIAALCKVRRTGDVTFLGALLEAEAEGGGRGF
jgi:hypothetical protein